MTNDNHNPDKAELGEAQLTAYALGQLDSEERAKVEALLVRSDDARRFVDQTRAIGRELAEANARYPAPVASPALREAVEKRLAGTPIIDDQTGPTPSTRKRSVRRWLLAGSLATTACLLIGAAAFVYDALRGTDDRTELLSMHFRGGVDESSAGVELQANAHTGGLPEKEELELLDESVNDYEEVNVSEFGLSNLPSRGGLHALESRSPPFADEAPIVYPNAEVWDELTARRSEQYQPGDLAFRTSGNAFQNGAELGSPDIRQQQGFRGAGQLFRVQEGQQQPGGKEQPGSQQQPRDQQQSTSPPSDDAQQVHPLVASSTYTSQLEERVRRIEEARRNRQVEREDVPAEKWSHKVGGRAMLDADVLARNDDDREAELKRRVAELEAALREEGEQPCQDDYGPYQRRAHTRPGDVPGTEQYEPIVENPFLPAEEVPLSTFSIDVDTASYANVRRFLREGRWPPPGAVRIEEMVNYFQYDYPGPQGEHPFAIHVEVAGCPWQPEHRLLRIGLKGREIDRKERGPSNLVFLLDVSGSMSDEDKLPLVKQAMRLLTEQLAEDDRVAIVTYRDDAKLRLESTRGNEKDAILAVIDSLHATGSTHGSAGIKLAYREAAEHFVKGGTNRVILATDGDLNVGVTDDDELVGLIQKQAKTGVFLTILGVGTGNLKDAKLEKIADRGNGQYAYVDNLREARKVLVEQMTGSLMTIAKDVKIQLDFNFAEVAAYRLVGYENRTLAARDFDDDRKDAGEIGAGHTVTALYEIVPRGAAAVAEPGRPRSKYQRVPPPEELNDAARSGELVSVSLRYKLPDENESRLVELAVEDAGKRFGRASADFRFAAAVAAFGMVLRDSVYRGDVTLAAVEEYTAGALGEDPKGRRAEFLDLVRRARQVDP